MTISRIWRAFGLQPHRSETFKLSPDPLLVEKVRDIAGLYMNPPDHTLVFMCRWPGQLERRTHYYKRHGTTSLFAALDLKSGRVTGRLGRPGGALGRPTVLSVP